MKTIPTLSLLLLLSTFALDAQNIGVNTTSPSQPLEVGGIIFTNAGGVMFPDSTLQTTAAASSGATDATDNAGLYGVMTMIGVDGPFNQMPFENGFVVYEMENLIEREFAIGGGGGGGSAPTPGIGNFIVTIDIGKGFSPLMAGLFDGQPVSTETNIFLLNEIGEEHFRIELSDTWILGIEKQLVYRGGGEYAHLARVSMTAERIIWHDIENNECFCWNRLTNTSCGCP